MVEVLRLASSAEVSIIVPMRNNGQTKLSSISTSTDLLSIDATVFLVGGHRRQTNNYQTDNVFFSHKVSFRIWIHDLSQNVSFFISLFACLWLKLSTLNGVACTVQ